MCEERWRIRKQRLSVDLPWGNLESCWHWLNPCWVSEGFYQWELCLWPVSLAGLDLQTFLNVLIFHWSQTVQITNHPPLNPNIITFLITQIKFWLLQGSYTLGDFNSASSQDSQLCKVSILEQFCQITRENCITWEGANHSWSFIIHSGSWVWTSRVLPYQMASFPFSLDSGSERINISKGSNETFECQHWVPVRLG